MKSLIIQYKFQSFLLATLVILSITSCKKFIEVESPPTSTNADVVYNTDAQAIAVLTGIYAKMATDDFLSPNPLAVNVFTGLSADELTLFNLNNIVFKPYYSNTLSSKDLNSTFWSKIFPVIFVANSALEGLNSSTELTPSVKQQLIGEAKFIRAFCYFFLVNLYGDVPLALSTDYKVNSLLSRTSKADVYSQIISDLKDDQTLLSSNYLNGVLQPYSSATEKVRPTKWAATTLLARAYLFTGEWANAETQATSVISNTSFSLDSLNGVFFKNSKEAIWQIQPVATGNFSNTRDGALFVLPSSGPAFNYPVYLNNVVLNSFEAGDQRRVKWVNSVTVSISGTPTTFYYPYKYKIGQVNAPVTEYSMVLRLAEVYLIRAEARAKQNNLSGAIADIDMIRQRAGLPLISATNPGISQSALLTAILHERQVELFTEWGHRWFDLKRTGNVDAVMGMITPTKGGTWQTADQLYPIPQSEIDKSPHVVQNAGY